MRFLQVFRHEHHGLMFAAQLALFLGLTLLVLSVIAYPTLLLIGISTGKAADFGQYIGGIGSIAASLLFLGSIFHQHEAMNRQLQQAQHGEDEVAVFGALEWVVRCYDILQKNQSGFTQDAICWRVLPSLDRFCRLAKAHYTRLGNSEEACRLFASIPNVEQFAFIRADQTQFARVQQQYPVLAQFLDHYAQGRK